MEEQTWVLPLKMNDVWREKDGGARCMSSLLEQNNQIEDILGRKLE